VLDRAGKKLPALDSLIAALAIHHDCALVTRNESDFAVAELQVINPWK
jgi:predicted nucleic acid-binding protein